MRLDWYLESSKHEATSLVQLASNNAPPVWKILPSVSAGCFPRKHASGSAAGYAIPLGVAGAKPNAPAQCLHLNGVSSKQWKMQNVSKCNHDIRRPLAWSSRGSEQEGQMPKLEFETKDKTKDSIVTPLQLESCWGFPVSHACRTEPFADRLWHILARFALLLAVSKMPLRHPVCGRITYHLGLNPAGVSLFRMHAAQSPLRTDGGTFSHAFALLLAVSKMPLRHPVCGQITYPLRLNPAGVSLFRMHAAQSPLRTDCGTFSHARRCGEKHIWKKMLKNCSPRNTFWSSDVATLHAAVAKSTFGSENVKKL